MSRQRTGRPENLRADCSKCCALCCAGPAFDREQGFGFDKPAHTPCVNLDRQFRCIIHAELLSHGFPACARFDCYGAGQRVTRLFAGETWLQSPELAQRMFDAYRTYRSLHELLVLLDAAIGRAPPSATTQLQALRRAIDDLCESGAAMSEAVDVATIRREVLCLVQDTFRDH